MATEWYVKSPDDDDGHDEGEWEDLIERSPELQPGGGETESVPNPFKPGELMMVGPNEASVGVVVDGVRVGDIERIFDDWGDDPPMALEATAVSGEEERMLAVLKVIAKELDGEIGDL